MFLQKNNMVLAATGILLLSIPSAGLARSNVVTLGLATALDYSDREYDLVDDPETEIDERLTAVDDDFKQFLLIPSMLFQSSSPRDNLELELVPALTYDLDEEETDWNGTVRLAADRFINRDWQVGIENTYLRTDYYRTPNEPLESINQAAANAPALPSAPELSPDIGRQIYDRNALNLYSDYTYRPDSLLRVGFNYVILRYDEEIDRDQDYDRYELLFLNNHRFNPVWSTSLDFRYVVGDFEETELAGIDGIVGGVVPEGEAVTDIDSLSEDLKEYRLLARVDNEAINQNLLYAQYQYIGLKYDETLRNDSDIHQMRFNWRRDYSSRFYTIAGIGPSYVDTENRDSEWDANGIVEANYLFERGALNFSAENRLDVESFDGTRDDGPADIWDVGLAFDYRLTRNLIMLGRLSYIHEERTDAFAALETILGSANPQDTLAGATIEELEEYDRDRYIAGISLEYAFMRDYTARLDYDYIDQESDLIGDTYDEHRVILTLSWQKDIFRW